VTGFAESLVAVLRSPILAYEAVLLAACLALIGAEAGWSRVRGLHLYDPGESLVNFTTYAGFFLVTALWTYWVYGAYQWAYAHRVASITTGGFHLGARHAWEWGALLLADDFIFYWHHRALHRVRLLWTSHYTHHSSRFFNLSCAFRQTWLPFFAWPFWIVLPLLGFDPLMVLSMQFASLFWQVLLHTQVVGRLGPLEWIFNTPSHHRVHHGADAPYVDKNFGGILIVWDRLFGTFQAERADTPLRYGLHEPIAGLNPLSFTLREFGRWLHDVARTPLQALHATFAPP
jgi:sterol desaturase/sphingolipid hydroxylase (fatty acid hydroxylase superfamily)